MKLPKYTKNFYFLSGLIFLVWLLFVDSNDLVNQFKITSQLNGLEKEKEYYQEKIIEVEKERQNLLNNPSMLEKYAREKYLMKKPNEDIYVVVEEE